MTSIVFAFEVHQPFRLREFVNENSSNLLERYFDIELNKFYLNRISEKCYLKTNEIILDLIDQFKKEKKKFKVAFSISGIFLEALEKYRKDVLESFRELAKKKEVEILCETYYHSIVSLHADYEEFIKQVEMQRETLNSLLNVNPKVFVNTEMIFNNKIAKVVEDLGFKAIYTEGVERILKWKSPNYVYVRKYAFPNDPIPKKRIKILLRNYRLSDDIAFRFSARNWDQWPLTADKYASWLAATPGDVINIFIDYETFGEHHWEESGIFWFLKALPHYVLKYEHLEFDLPSEVIKKYNIVGEYDVFELSSISWADSDKDVSAWLGNEMQLRSFEEVMKLRNKVLETNDEELYKIWQLFTQSDIYYYMCKKSQADQDVHQYFNHYKSAEKAFVSFMNILADFKAQLEIRRIRKSLKEILASKNIIENLEKELDIKVYEKV
ncbi:MAG: glycoside hydrolase family 57 protein [Candidatus Aenigmatarchaeota archaeon]